MTSKIIPFRPKNGEYRRWEMRYGTPGTTIYRNGKEVLWVPDDFGSLSKRLSHEEVEALRRELEKYLKSHSPNGRVK